MREMDGAERYPDTTRGLEYTNDLDEGVMEEGVPVYEATINEGGKKFVEEVDCKAQYDAQAHAACCVPDFFCCGQGLWILGRA